MSFEMRGETVIGAHELAELKQVFRALHAHLPEHPDLMDTHFLAELQRFLHRRAIEDGVEIADHAAWDRWLAEGSTPWCNRRKA